jgi:hypothetical protein
MPTVAPAAVPTLPFIFALTLMSWPAAVAPAASDRRPAKAGAEMSEKGEGDDELAHLSSP